MIWSIRFGMKIKTPKRLEIKVTKEKKHLHQKIKMVKKLVKSKKKNLQDFGIGKVTLIEVKTKWVMLKKVKDNGSSKVYTQTLQLKKLNQSWFR